METIVFALTIDNWTIAAQILNHFAFGKAKAANWEIKGTRILKLVPVRNRKKKEKIRAEENREEDFVFISCNHITLLGWFVQPLLQDIYLISNKGEEFWFCHSAKRQLGRK